jgi:hypothetical protein
MKRENVVVGDWSQDGHNMTENFVIEMEDHVNTGAALAAAKTLFGFEMDDFCADYEDSEFPSQLIKEIYTEANFRNISMEGVCFEDDDDLQEEKVYLGYDEFFGLWLAYLNVGVVMVYGPDYRVREVKGSTTHNIGGYGLFSS